MNNPNGYKSKDSILCVRLPPKVHSNGFWDSKNPFSYSLPVLQLQIVVFFGLTQILFRVMRPFGIPKFVAELLVGGILGSTLFGRHKQYQAILFPIESQGILGTLSAFGYVMFFFLATVKMDVSMIKKTGLKALAIGALNFFGPFVVGLITVSLLKTTMLRDEDTSFLRMFPSLVMGHCTIPFPVIACLLEDLKILNSDLGRIALSSALVGNCLSIGVLCCNIVFNISQTYSAGRGLVDITLALMFMAAIVFGVRPVFNRMAKRTPEGGKAKDVCVCLIVLGAFLCGVITKYFELEVLMGPLIYGLVVPAGPPLGSALVETLDSFVSGMFMPLFVSLNMVTTNLQKFNLSPAFAVSNMILYVVMLAAKTVGAMAPALYYKMSFKDSLALGLIMSAKGVVDLAFFRMMKDLKIINGDIFTIMIVAIAISSTLVPMAVKRLYNPSTKYVGYRRRNIMNSKRSDGLPILVCIRQPDNVTSIIDLLNASSPSADSPVAVSVLHLIELRGRASPVFISHHSNDKNTIVDCSYSGDIIAAFTQYTTKNAGATTLQAYTVISPCNVMHEDICTLALNKLASIIVVPFHRKWGADGSIESEDHSLRTVYCSVLYRAPCSVGILISRRNFENFGQLSSKPFRVAMIFLGGNDDQEGLTYASRMAKNPNVCLTVIRLISMDDQCFDDTEFVRDLEVLNDAKHGKGVQYIEKMVTDGPETAVLVGPLVSEFELIIVGRRKNLRSPQTEGLDEWSEFPELGVIGDLLVSPDLRGDASILVLQQQLSSG